MAKRSRDINLPAPYLKRLWLETDVLADEDKPEPFRLNRTASNWWSSKGRTKSDLDI